MVKATQRCDSRSCQNNTPRAVRCRSTGKNVPTATAAAAPVFSITHRGRCDAGAPHPRASFRTSASEASRDRLDQTSYARSDFKGGPLCARPMRYRVVHGECDFFAAQRFRGRIHHNAGNFTGSLLIALMLIVAWATTSEACHGAGPARAVTRRMIAAGALPTGLPRATTVPGATA